MNQVEAKSSWLASAATSTKEIIQAGREQGEVQKKMYAVTRTAIGIIATSYHWPAAIAGGTVAVMLPGVAKQATSLADAGTTWLWNKLPFDTKMPLAVAGVGLTILGATQVPLIGTLLVVPGALFSAKLGAELGLRNLAKEEVAQAEAKAKTEAS